MDPKYAEQIMQESLMMGETTPASGRKGPASETAANTRRGREANQKLALLPSNQKLHISKIMAEITAQVW